MQQEAMVSNCSKTWRIQNSVWTSGQQTLFTFRVASVYLPFFFRLLLDEHLKNSTYWTILWHASKEMLGCTEGDVAFHWPCNQVYGSCCHPIIHSEWNSLPVCVACSVHGKLIQRKTTIFSIWAEMILFRLPFRFSSVFLPGPVFCTLPPFTLPFLFRFSSGAASLEDLLFRLPFTLPFLFRFSSGTMCFSRMWILGTLWYHIWVLIAEASLPYIGV